MMGIFSWQSKINGIDNVIESSNKSISEIYNWRQYVTTTGPVGSHWQTLSARWSCTKWTLLSSSHQM
jgi:hypothetical protein